MGCSVYQLQSDQVRTARGHALIVLLLHEQLQLVARDWIAQIADEPLIDPAMIADRVEDSIGPAVVEGLETIARRKQVGKRIELIDLLVVAEAANNPAAMLSACVRNRVRECVSQERRRVQRGQNAGERKAQLDNMKSTLSIEDRLDLMEALDKLDDDEKIAIQLYHIEGWSQPQIARVTGVSQSTVQRRIARGTAKLKEMLS